MVAELVVTIVFNTTYQQGGVADRARPLITAPQTTSRLPQWVYSVAGLLILILAISLGKCCAEQTVQQVQQEELEHTVYKAVEKAFKHHFYNYNG
eukprot:700947-Prorocentrum_lima.AAC.1